MMLQEISVDAAIVLSELDGIFTLKEHKNSPAQDFSFLARDATIKILRANHLLRSQEAVSGGETPIIQQANQPIPNRKFHDTSPHGLLHVSLLTTHSFVTVIDIIPVLFVLFCY